MDPTTIPSYKVTLNSLAIRNWKLLVVAVCLMYVEDRITKKGKGESLVFSRKFGADERHRQRQG